MQIEGVKTYPDMASLPTLVHDVSVVTPQHLSEAIVEQAAAISVQNIWFQPGVESERANARAQELGMNVVAGGPCILVVLRYRERGSQAKADTAASTESTHEQSDQDGTKPRICRIEPGNK